MRRLLPIVLILSVFLASYTSASAAGYQQCTVSQSCTIGEFLYDDNYSPLVGASCTLTAKYPDNTSFIASGSMTGGSDGWYSYDATIGTTEGLYHANICCTPTSGTLCIDKSFEVKSASGSSLTPAAIWGYSDRTLTGYGTLVSDIWNYSGRTLTSFGSLVSDIWGYSGRTLTSFGSLVENIWGAEPASTTASSIDPSSLKGIIAEQTKQRELLEKLVNAPVISLSLDDGGNVPDLQSKITESKKHANLLYDNISSAKSRLLSLDTKWDRITLDSATSEITAIAGLFQNQDSLNYLTKAWDTQTVTNLNSQMDELKSNLSTLLTTTTLNKTKLTPAPLVATLNTLGNLEETLGDTTSTSSDSSFFGHLSSVIDRDASLRSENQKIAALLENLNGQGTNTVEREISSLKSRLLTLNQYPGGESIVAPAKGSDNQKINFKNILFSLQALVGLNTQILAMNVGDPVRSLWLEEGSIIFRAVITNPSSVISQTVPLKFYLPREVKTEDIMMIDPSLSTTYDSSEEALYASGNFDLKPKETKVVFVEVEDIWLLTSSEIETLRTQAINLLKPLEKTAYFSQGTTLKSDIDVTLDKVLLSTGKAVTPENRIRAYREGKLELTKVAANMNRLEDLVAQSSGTGSIFGFVGGIQTVAVWGIILVVIAGFIFLSIYFKKLSMHQSPQEVKIKPMESVPEQPRAHLSKLEVSDYHPSKSWQMPALIAAVVVVTAGSTIWLTQLAKPKSDSVVNQIVPTTQPSPITTPSPIPSPSSSPLSSTPPQKIDIKSEKSILGTTTSMKTLTVPEDSSVNIRNKPSASADIIMAIKESQDIYVFEEDGDWIQIGFKESDSTKGYWVNVKFVTEK